MLYQALQAPGIPRLGRSKQVGCKFMLGYTQLFLKEKQKNKICRIKYLRESLECLIHSKKKCMTKISDCNTVISQH